MHEYSIKNNIINSNPKGIKANIMIVGVGGQGSLLASKVIGTAAIKKGLDVKVSEVHGMSQRGGSVVTYVKMGDRVYSPLVEKGEADFIISFEKLEALRWAEYIAKDGTIIINDQHIDPMPVITGEKKYPLDVIEKISGMCDNTIVIDAFDIAKNLGNIKVVNIVLIGVYAKISGIEKEIWEEALRDVVNEKYLAINLKAFEEGYNY